MQSDATVSRRLGATTQALCGSHDLLLFDLDGVVYAGPDALPGAADRLAQCRQAGNALGFVTNNASRPAGEVAAHLRALGVDAADDDVVTAAQAAARMVADRVPAGSRVLVVGGAGLVSALAEYELTPVWSARDDPAAVVQGLHPSVGWEQLAEGAYALATGVPWVASNLDVTLPTDRGHAPGNGALVEALRVVSGREPEVAGKPEPVLFEECARRLGGARPLVVGDRIGTDIVGATRSGLPSLLVLTGISTLEEACAARGDERPSYVAPDLEGLLVPHPEVDQTDGTARCEGWAATVESGRVVLQRTERHPTGAGGGGREAPEDGGSRLAALRAVVTACWSYADETGDTADSGPARTTWQDMMT